MKPLQVFVVSSNNDIETQKLMNEWLEKHPDISPFDTQYIVAKGGYFGAIQVGLAIWYYEND